MILMLFYPRSPCGERPRRASRQQPAGEFSIHALLAESDRRPIFFWQAEQIFYPRSPCGERLTKQHFNNLQTNFLSTLSLRRATRTLINCNSNFTHFLSTLSLRRATVINQRIDIRVDFSIHALLAESDIDRVFPDP